MKLNYLVVSAFAGLLSIVGTASYAESDFQVDQLVRLKPKSSMNYLIWEAGCRIPILTVGKVTKLETRIRYRDPDYYVNIRSGLGRSNRQYSDYSTRTHSIDEKYEVVTVSFDRENPSCTIEFCESEKPNKTSWIPEMVYMPFHISEPEFKIEPLAPRKKSEEALPPTARGWHP